MRKDLQVFFTVIGTTAAIGLGVLLLSFDRPEPKESYSVKIDYFEPTGVFIANDGQVNRIWASGEFTGTECFEFTEGEVCFEFHQTPTTTPGPILEPIE